MIDVDLGPAAFWWLMLAGAVFGALSLFAFRRWSDEEELRAASNSMFAHLMEFRLFAEEPMLIWRAQVQLLAANARLLKVVLRPVLLLSVPSAIALASVSAFFERAPLRAGEATVITAHYSQNSEQPARLLTPDWIHVETPPVHVPGRSEISWRIRPSRESVGSIALESNSHAVSKTVSSVPGLHWISEQRSGLGLGFLMHPQELPISGGTVDWVRVQYPPATIFGLHWLLWFSVAACGGAFLSTLGGFVR